MKPRQAFVAFIVLLAVTSLQQVRAQTGGIAMSIERHAVLTEQGQVVIRIHISCGPFAGLEDFQEGHAGGSQAKTSAEAETGIDGTVVCDGVERVHTAHLSSFTDGAFKHGPATVSASLTVCMLVEDEQTCFSGGTSRRVIIRGGSLS